MTERTPENSWLDISFVMPGAVFSVEKRVDTATAKPAHFLTVLSPAHNNERVFVRSKFDKTADRVLLKYRTKKVAESNARALNAKGKPNLALGLS